MCPAGIDSRRPGRTTTRLEHTRPAGAESRLSRIHMGLVDDAVERSCTRLEIRVRAGMRVVETEERTDRAVGANIERISHFNCRRDAVAAVAATCVIGCAEDREEPAQLVVLR